MLRTFGHNNTATCRRRNREVDLHASNTLEAVLSKFIVKLHFNCKRRKFSLQFSGFTNSETENGKKSGTKTERYLDLVFWIIYLADTFIASLY